MAVRALVGSADFFDDAQIFGQVNGAAAKRSPGSALKPFIYALAMDQGLIHTQTVLKDAPTSFGVYSPENFDGTFVGPVSAHDALIASRNVPAVAAGRAAGAAQPVSVPALGRRVAHGQRTALWSGAGTGWRRSHHGGDGRAVRHAGQ